MSRQNIFVLLQQSCSNVERVLIKLSKYFFDGWRLAVLDHTAGRWLVEPCPSNIAYLKAANAAGRHILMQPVNEAHYMVADDISVARLYHDHKSKNGFWKKGRLVVETSPGNYQVWIRSDRHLSVEEKKYWLKKMKSDPAATPLNRWGRMPGFRNRKEKYQTNKGHYPLAKLVWVDWQNKASIPVIIKQIKNIASLPKQTSINLQHSISRKDYERGNESVTDFSYSLALARRGYDASQIKSKILAERNDWGNHKGEKRTEAYLERTLRKALNIIANT